MAILNPGWTHYKLALATPIQEPTLHNFPPGAWVARKPLGRPRLSGMRRGQKSTPELICELGQVFYNLGWVSGTGGGISIRDGWVWDSEGGRRGYRGEEGEMGREGEGGEKGIRELEVDKMEESWGKEKEEVCLVWHSNKCLGLLEMIFQPSFVATLLVANVPIHSSFQEWFTWCMHEAIPREVGSW